MTDLEDHCMTVLEDHCMTVLEDHCRDPGQQRATRDWVARSVRLLEAEAARSADTHLYRLPLPADWGTDLYLKDEAAQPTGSLKHRLARSLFLYSLCNGWIGPGTAVVEASSGSTAVSEAYFAQLIGIPFVAVMPRSVSREKVRLIESHGGDCHFVDGPADMTPAARRLAAERGGHFLDQFTYAERATDWRGNNNIAESLFAQLRRERHPVPEWIVVGAGTGGTSATIGRYLRYRGHPTRLAVADPENSAFLDAWLGRRPPEAYGPLRIEGIGRPAAEPSFLPTVVDRMLRVPDAASIAAMRWLREHTGHCAGPSTGTNLWAAVRLADEMARAGQPGSLVTLLCDTGERYAATCYDDRWLAEHNIDIAGYRDILRKMLSM